MLLRQKRIRLKKLLFPLCHRAHARGQGLVLVRQRRRGVSCFSDALIVKQYNTQRRDACCHCLSIDLVWQDVSPKGTLIASTRIHASANTYFQERTPWLAGTVQLDVGPAVICHVHGDCVKGKKVKLINRLDKSGQGVLFALPLQKSLNMYDDLQLREMSCDPKFRRILITDGRNETGFALVKAFSEAESGDVFVGWSEVWRSDPQYDVISNLPNVENFAFGYFRYAFGT